jgi:hypothetical protein
MQIYVSPEDIRGAGPGIIQSPIARALQRVTGTKWRVWNGEVAYELLPPYRTVALPDEVQFMWDEYPDLRDLPPFAFEIELEEPLQAVLNRDLISQTEYAA